MLYFSEDEVCVNQERRYCQLCLDRVGNWKTKLKEGEKEEEGGDVVVCGWCLLYSGRTRWGHENREELLEVGRAATELAAKHCKKLPALDERARLSPGDAERFVMGVSFTSRVMVDRLGHER